MDYIEAFQNLRTNNKYGRKSPHKAVLMLTVIELFEQNKITVNEIPYDDNLKEKFLHNPPHTRSLSERSSRPQQGMNMP